MGSSLNINFQSITSCKNKIKYGDRKDLIVGGKREEHTSSVVVRVRLKV